MHTDSLNLNRCIFFRHRLSLTGSISQDISVQKNPRQKQLPKGQMLRSSQPRDEMK